MVISIIPAAINTRPITLNVTRFISTITTNALGYINF
jgi:hypothetical protein